MAKNPIGAKDSQTKAKRPSHSPFLPSRSILLVTPAGPREIPSDQVSSSAVGWKALGLSALPPEWAPPFFVVSNQCFEQETPAQSVNNWISDALAQLSLGSDLMIRSSGTAETIHDRGSLDSTLCTSTDISASLNRLRTKLKESSQAHVHWIIQQAITPQLKGHLSNERRVSKEPRDWGIEFEPIGDRIGYAVSIGIRAWREGKEPSSYDLSCGSEKTLTANLREVAKWGLQFSTRIHFEWVWNGTRLWVVQADAAKSGSGIDPTHVLPAKLPSTSVVALEAFRPAHDNDYAIYKKLGNAALYKQLGYDMPSFFLIDDRSTITDLLAGKISPGIEKDFAELIKRPLIIRTDGTNIPEEKREMLPRSDQLATSDEAKEWLQNTFTPEIIKLDLANQNLCLIAHHFIPSVASAWARAEPGNPIVLIESLWGIPEGLYYHSHDTFEVDTREVKLKDIKSFAGMSFPVSEHLRHKGIFIAADHNGKWAPAQVRAPHDWTSSIKKQEWLFEIAHTTRRVAEGQNDPVAVMWFIDNHPEATRHKVLPWYHSKSELFGIPRAAPRRKITTANDFHIENEADWAKIQQRLREGPRIERVVVQPSDVALIRNPTFAKELADLAATHKFVIELSGGILSHAYYMLTKRGAQVECIDLFGLDEDRVDYNKIVRDKIPTIISKRGELAEIIRLQGAALTTALKQKLVEEALEALDARSRDDLVGELADVREVIDALCIALKVSDSHLDTVQSEKRQKRGGFEKGIMLARTTTPHSIHRYTSSLPETMLQFEARSASSQIIADSADLPAVPLYRRPDLRQVEQQIEKLFAFATEINKLETVKASLEFSLPIGAEDARALALTIELRRSRSTLRGNIRVRVLPSQLPITFPDESK